METQSKESESIPPPPAYQASGSPTPQIPYGFPGSAIGQPGGYTTVAVQDQPNAPPAIIWMPAPPPIPKCPPGLEYLSQIDQISIQQQIELMEMISGFETCNRYEIKNTLGQWIYFAAEENDDFTLNCYGPLRPFTIKLFDSTQQPVMQLTRSFHCSICCCPCICCLQELEVQAPLGTIIGYIKQKWHPCLPKFAIQNEAREDVLRMAGPCVPCRCWEDIHFEVKALDGKSEVGRISRQWTGFAREAATDASIFGIQFPLDMEIKTKAMIMGAAFLMDYMFFERSSKRSSRTRSQGFHRRHGAHGIHGRHGAHGMHLHHRR